MTDAQPSYDIDREEAIDRALAHYLNVLKHDSPIVSTSHIVYGRYARTFGDDFRKAVDRHFGREP